MTTTNALKAALRRGDPAKVAALIAAGADVQFVDEDGKGAFHYATHDRAVQHDPRLLNLLRLLLEHRAPPGETAGPRIDADLGHLVVQRRLDAIALLLEAGADEGQLGWTPLHRAVALGSVDDVQRLLDDNASIRDHSRFWGGDALDLAIYLDDAPKVRLLLDADAAPDRDRIEAAHAGISLDEYQKMIGLSDDERLTLLQQRLDDGDASAWYLWCTHPAGPEGLACRAHYAPSATGIRLLLAAGLPLAELPKEPLRRLLGLPPDPDPTLLDLPYEQAAPALAVRFGTTNPTPMNGPFQLVMVRSGVNAHAARRRYGLPWEHPPVWCADRFGQSITALPDGRFVLVGGEHEDFYDPDFCIYNDVWVVDADGQITIYGYPEDVFPPTDFHTATQVGDHLILIGALGYGPRRHAGHTPVYRLDLHTFQIERLNTVGDLPGWIYKHEATLTADGQIDVEGGQRLHPTRGRFTVNPHRFTLDLTTLRWTRLDDPSAPRWEMQRTDGARHHLVRCRMAWHRLSGRTIADPLRPTWLDRPPRPDDEPWQPPAPDDLRLIDTLYLPDGAAFVSETSEVETVTVIRFDDVEIVFTEGRPAIQAEARGPLSPERLAALQAHLLDHLRQLEGVPWEVVPA